MITIPIFQVLLLVLLFLLELQAWILPAPAARTRRHEKRLAFAATTSSPSASSSEFDPNTAHLSYDDDEEQEEEKSSSGFASSWDDQNEASDEDDSVERELKALEELDGTTEDSLPGSGTQQDPWVVEFQRWVQAAEKCRTNLETKQRSLQTELQKAQSLEATVQRANLITSHMYLFNSGVRSAVVQDWENGEEVELILDPAYDSASQEADALFQQARKLKRGSQKVAELLAQTSTAMQLLDDVLQDFRSLKTITEFTVRLLQDKLLQISRVTNFEAPSAESASGISQQRQRTSKTPALGSPASNIRKLTTPAGCTILVGRNRRGNEYLSLSLAKGNDVWMHARGTPGAHVLLPQRRGSVSLTPECLQLAANLAVFYSDARSERRAPVTVASPKHLLKPRNAPLGAVQLRQEDRVIVGIPSDVPEELRLARNESGFRDEYRAADKAKHRKKTMAAASSKAKRKKSSSGKM